ncbi:MAG: hypothetical protein QM800_15000 [Paludibacter sp.]
MKTSMKLILVLLFTVFSVQTFAQKPEPVYSIVRQIHDFDWYEQQAKAWKQEIDNGTTNNMAWVYWFNANRYAAFADAQKRKDSKADYFQKPEVILKLAEKAIPNSFELFYLKTKDNSAGHESGEYILKAQAIRPYDPLLLPELMNHYQFKNDKTNLETVSKKWFESNEMPQEILTTAYNNLISLDTNAILITYGDNDTYPYWVLQNAHKLRTDVTVVNVSLALIDSYRETLFKENGIPALIIKNDSDREMKTVIKHSIENQHEKPVYISIFADQDIYKSYADKMYLVGLSYKYSKEPFDNLAVIRNSVENKYLLDFLKQSFYNNYAQAVVNQINTGYLAIFLKLYEHYLISGETDKAQKIKELAKSVAEKGNTTNWMKYFEK